MNNDMANNISNHIKVPSMGNVNFTNKKKTVQENEQNNSADKINHSMQLLDTLGKAQVFMGNMPKRVEQYTQEFIKNPENITMKMDFCDSLISRGYSLPRAVNKTGDVFRILNNKDTYIN